MFKGLIGFNKQTNKLTGIPSIFPLSCSLDKFVKQDMRATYLKILTDVLERTHGIPEDKIHLLQDSFVQTEGAKGLLSMLVEAIISRKEIFIVYKNDVIRYADREEQKTIENDYASKGRSSVGIWVSFRNYDQSEMLEIYSRLEYCIISSLNKTLGVSQAVQVKIDGLRSNVSLGDSEIAIEQGKAIADALSKGEDVLLDVKDLIETATPDVSSTDKAMIFVDGKKAWILGLPLSYINGEQTGGIGSTGEGDTRAIERGLKAFYYSIIKPVLFELMGIKTKFRSQDFRQMTSALDALRTFELSSGDIISIESMKEIMNRMLDLDIIEEKARLKAQEEEREKEIKEIVKKEMDIEEDIEWPM